MDYTFDDAVADLSPLKRMFEGLAMEVGVFVDATSPYFDAVAYVPGHQPTISDLEHFQERVSSIDIWVADGRRLLDRIIEFERTLSADVAGYGSRISDPDAQSDLVDWVNVAMNWPVLDLRQTLSDYLDDLRLLYGSAVSAADQVAADIERQAWEASARSMRPSGLRLVGAVSC